MVQRNGCGLPATRYSAPSLQERSPAGAMGHRRRKQTLCSRSRISNLHVIGNTGAEAALRGRASSRGLLRLRLVQPTEQFLLEPAHKLSERLGPDTWFSSKSGRGHLSTWELRFDWLYPHYGRWDQGSLLARCAGPK